MTSTTPTTPSGDDTATAPQAPPARAQDAAPAPAPSRSARRRPPVRMLHDRLLVAPEVDASERQTAAGLVIPATAVGPKKLAWGSVVAVGENVRRVGVGDRVLFDPDERAEVTLEGDDYVLLRERDLHGVSEAPVEGERTGLYL